MGVLQTVLGLVWLTVGGVLYAGQLISTVNFPLAQRPGLQERPGHVDPLFGQLEQKAAAWDLFAIWIPPVAGLLMLFDHAAWPAACLIAAGVYVDTGGREAAKVLGLAAHGLPVGSARERAIVFGTFSFFVLTGLAGAALGLAVLI